MTDSENFKKWFGNSELLTSDPLGTPIRFYHKSRAKNVFEEFQHEGVKKNPYNDDYGFFFVQEKDKKWCDYIGDGIDIYCYLRMQNPYLIWDDGNGGIVDCRNKKHDALYIPKSFVEEVSALQYDGIIIANEKHYSQYVVFSPNQIKSINNNGEFSLQTNNIFR